MKIDTTFNFYSDATGWDPDSSSPTLQAYHQMLWNKPLPCGTSFNLKSTGPNNSLWHRSHLGEFRLGSDAITHSYQCRKDKMRITHQIPIQVAELFALGSTIGAYTLFPNKQIDRQQTINQARGTHPEIDDRFDLTLECIRRHYLGEKSPLTDVLERYGAFFQLFRDFDGYVTFFLLQDLVLTPNQIKFHLPFEGFGSPAQINSVEEYLQYRESVMAFINARNRRIAAFAETT